MRLAKFCVYFFSWGLILSNLELRAGTQEIGIGGVGSVNHSMAGISVATPLDAAGGIYWNPATIGRLKKSEFQMGVGRTALRWYGDEVSGCSVLIPVFVILWLMSEDPLEDSDSSYSNQYYTNFDPHDPPDPPKSHKSKSRLPLLRVPSFSFVWPRNDEI